MSELHHIHRRKRRLEPYPHSNVFTRTIDMAALTAGIVGPTMTLPQVFKIYIEHNAAGVSVASWFAFAIADIPFIAYGIAHKDNIILSTYIAWFCLNLTVAVGALMFP